MLVLTRKTGEGIIIDDDIKITIIEVKGGNIRIGVDAPRDKNIHRQEVYDRIRKTNVEATHWSAEDLDAISNNLLTRKK